MRPATLICCVLLVLGSSRADDDEDGPCDCSNQRVGGFRVDLLRKRADNNDVEINRLFNAAWALEKKVNALDSGPNVDELKARVDAVTGNDCAENEFECSDRSGCVSSLQVCDGVNDCRDNSDEAENTCKVLTPEGSSWGAAVSHDKCFRKPANYIRIVINQEDRSEIAPSNVEVQVTTFLYTNDGDLSVGKAAGHYNFGTRTVSFRALDGDILDLSCHFNGYDDNSCHAFLSRGLHEEPCGEIVFSRE